MCVYIDIYTYKKIKNELQVQLLFNSSLFYEYQYATHQYMNREEKDLPQIPFFHYFVLHVHI